MATYPPYQQPLVDPRTGRVTKPWQLFFLSLSGGETLADGSVTLVKLEPIASPRLLGRGTAGTGEVEQLTIGAGLALTGTELRVTATGVEQVGYWSVITNGDPVSPELLFDSNGDAIMGFVPTP
jgi:hypothetical protein